MKQARGLNTFDLVVRLYRQLQLKTRNQLILVMMLVVIGSVSEVVSISLLMPVVMVFTDPNVIVSHSLWPSSLSEIDQAAFKYIVMSAFLFFVVLTSILKIYLLKVSTKFSFNTSSELATKAFDLSLHQDYEHHLNTNSSVIIDGIGQKINATIYAGLMPGLNLISATAILLFTVSFLAFVNPLFISLALFTFGSVYFLVIFSIKQRLNFLSEIFPQKSTAALKVVQEGLGDIRTIILGHSQHLYTEKFQENDLEYKMAQREAAVFAGLPKIIIEMTFITLMMGAVLLLEVSDADLTSALPTLAVFVFAAQKLLPLLQAMYSGYTSLTSAKHAIRDVLDLVEQKAAVYPSSAPRLSFDSHLTLKRLFFSYRDSSKPILKDISIKINKNEIVGVTGKSGSGKSTLCDIMMGLLMPTSGTMHIDDCLINSDNVSRYRAIVAQVPQNVFLLDSDFYENITTIASNDLSDQQKQFVRDLCCKLQLNDFILNLPNGYDSLIGERGSKISGGQRQRLGIARALFCKPEILFLDEVTSALDSETAQQVMEIIYSLSDITILIISHDESTLYNCDTIFKVESSQIKLSKVKKGCL